MQPETGPRSGFIFNVNLVFLSQVVIYALAFGLRVVLARGLGDEGLGTYSLFFLAVLVAAGVGSLGVGLGNVYFLNKGGHPLPELLANSLVLLALSSALTWAALLAYGLLAQPQLFVSGRAFWLYAAAVPTVAAYLVLTSFLHGTSRFLAMSGAAVSQSLSGLAMAASLYFSGALDVFSALAAWVGSFALADLIALALIGPRHLRPGLLLRPRWGLLWRQVRYGAQGQIANLAQLFNYRLDQFLVAAFVSRAGVGQYAVAVGLGESVWWISSAVAMVLMPRLTSMGREEAEELTPPVSRNTLVVSLLAGAALVAASPLVIPLLFGREFQDAVPPLMLLMPGIVAASGARVLGSYLFSQGQIIYNTYTTLITLALTIALDLALIPLWGVPGAAAASSIAYGGSLAAALFFYWRVSGKGVWEALVFRPSDRRYYAGLLQRLLGRAVAGGKEAA